MWQNIIIGVIVLLCAIYVGRKFFRQARGQAGCGCSSDCSGCTPPPVGGPGKPPGEPPGGCGCADHQ